jgi:photosystem II stability/assembly factor-like uncharacterized protein
MRRPLSRVPALVLSAALAAGLLPGAVRAEDGPAAPPMVEKKKAEDGAAPKSDAEIYRERTPVEPSELQAVDAGYRWLVEQIVAGRADKRIMRQHAWLKPRLMPFDRPIPEGWRERARDRQLAAPPLPPRGLRTGADAADAAALPAVGRWIPVGPYNIPGRVTGLARPGGLPGQLLVANADGGLWRTRDAGASWEPLTEREATQASGSVLADPVDPLVFWWGTGEGNGAIDNYGGIGVLKTVDGGRTWTASNRFSGTVRCMAIHPSNRAQVWACGDDGLYRSSDGGATFAKVPGLPANGASGIAIRPDDPQRIFVGLWGGGVWKSADGGSSWSQVGGGLPANLGRVDLALCGGNPAVMLAVSEQNGGDLWKSADGGAHWSQLTAAPDFAGGQGWYDLAVAMAPDDCGTIYVGGVGSHVSRDGGASFAALPSAAGPVGWDYHAALAFPGGEVVFGCDSGVYSSLDYGFNWVATGQGLPTTQFYGGCGHDADAAWLAGGTQDNGTDQTKTGEPWRYIRGGDGGKCVAVGQEVLTEYQVTNLQKSFDGGNGWVDANGGIRADDPRAWVGIFDRDPSAGRTIYVGTNRVYRTTDFHPTNWKEILGPVYYSRMVSALAVSPADRNVLWVGYEYGGLYRTTNALAANPAFVSRKGPWPNRTVTRVTPHPSAPGAAWAVLGGYGYPKIYRTTDAGVNWTDVTGDFPDLPVTDLVVDPGDTGVLLAATDLGIFRSADGGAHWYGFSDGLPLSAVADLFTHPAGGDLVAATHGRSFYRFRPASSVAVAVPDGRTVPGRPLAAERTADGSLWLRRDTAACTAARYHLFYGPLAAVSQAAYSGEVCDVGRGGEALLAMPAPGESLYFVVAAASEAGTEGPHWYGSNGLPAPASGVGRCGVTAQESAASCP